MTPEVFAAFFLGVCGGIILGLLGIGIWDEYRSRPKRR